MATTAAVREIAREGEAARRRIPAKPATVGKVVTQAQLGALAEKELELRGVKARMKELEQEIAGARLTVLHGLKRGFRIEDGAYDAIVKVVKGRRTPSWKDEFARVAGPEEVEAVIERTEPSPDTDTIEVVRRSDR
jgi:hypothetical protein